VKSLRTVFAAAAIASFAAACNSGGNSGAVPPASKSNAVPGSTHAVMLSHVKTGKRQIFYSRSYLKLHPQFAALGPHALKTRLAPANNLLYGGGPIQKVPHIYLIFWGWSSQNDTTHDPSGLATYLINYVSALGGSNYANIATQYYENARGYITNPTGQLSGTWFDSSQPPQNYAESDIQSEANKAITRFGYNADADYFVVTPHGVTTSGFGTQWCAFHNSMTSGNGPVAYTDFPYIPDAGQGCGQGSVNSPGTLDGVSIVGGHEMTETITDPGAGNGWIDANGQEIGDKCAWTNLQNDVMYGGASFPNQPEWSNATSSCVHTYGTPPTPTPSPVPTPTPTPTSTSTPKPTPTPSGSPTPKPTSTPAGCSGQLLVNPGFESGQTGWSSTSGVINTDGQFSHTGVGYAWLDGYGFTHTDTLSQSVRIPAGCHATLSYWLMIQTQEYGNYPYDVLKLQVNGTTLQTFSNLNAGPYAQTSVDISRYAGTTAAIKWTGTEDQSLATSFFIDDTAVTLH